jgi:hypothetical protein
MLHLSRELLLLGARNQNVIPLLSCDPILDGQDDHFVIIIFQKGWVSPEDTAQKK